MLEVRAKITLRDVSTLTPLRRKAIAAWLRRQATMLLIEHKTYSDRFTARYYTKVVKSA